MYLIPLYVIKQAQVVFAVNIVVVVVVVVLYLVKSFGLDCICLFEYVEIQIFLCIVGLIIPCCYRAFSVLSISCKIYRGEREEKREYEEFFSLLNVGNRHFFHKKLCRRHRCIIIAFILNHNL